MRQTDDGPLRGSHGRVALHKLIRQKSLVVMGSNLCASHHDITSEESSTNHAQETPHKCWRRANTFPLLR